MPPSKTSDHRIAKLKAAKAQADEEKQWAYDNQAKVYEERDLLVRALSKVYPSHLMRHRGTKTGNRKPVVCINHPAVGQMCWTLLNGDEQAEKMFSHLEWKDNDWDGHRTADRYDRLSKL